MGIRKCENNQLKNLYNEVQLQSMNLFRQLTSFGEFYYFFNWKVLHFTCLNTTVYKIETFNWTKLFSYPPYPIKKIDSLPIMSSSMFLVNRQTFDRRREVLDKKIAKWQIKEKRFFQSLIEATEFCCLNTSLHGLRNIYESVVEYNGSKSRYK